MAESSDPPTRPVNLAIQSGDFDPEAPDPGDTDALMRLRGAIDDCDMWPTQQTRDDGDYELCVRWMAEEIRQLRNRVTEAERTRSSTLTLAAHAHRVARHLVDLTEPAARVHELEQLRKPIEIPAPLVDEFGATIDAPAAQTEKPKGNRPT